MTDFTVKQTKTTTRRAEMIARGKKFTLGELRDFIAECADFSADATVKIDPVNQVLWSGEKITAIETNIETGNKAKACDCPVNAVTIVDGCEHDKCRDHRLVQHRDGKPPWCKTCGKSGTESKS